MRRPPIAVLIALVALVALAVVGGVTGSTASHAARPSVATAPVTSATLVCPDVGGAATATTSYAIAADVAAALSPPSKSAGTVTATVLARAKSKRTTVSPSPEVVVGSQPKTDEAIAIAANGSVAASLVADQGLLTSTGRYRALSGVRCVAPATDWWFAGADGRVGFSDVLAVANPAPTAAEVTITLWGAKGPVATTRLETMRVPPMSATRIGIATIAPDLATLAVHVHATSGAVSASLLDRRTAALRSDGGDYLPATAAPGRSAVVAGFAPGPGPRQLVLADPGSLAATVDLRLVTSSGSFTPAGDNQVVVRAGHTLVVSLDRAFDRTTGAVALTSDQPVSAEGLSVTTSTHRPDLMWLAAAAPLVGSAGFALGRAPDGGHTLLLLSAPKAAGQVQVTTPEGGSRSITVPAGRSVTVDITTTVKPAKVVTGTGSWPFVVTSTGAGPVYGVRVLSFAGAHGALITGEPLVALPTPIVLPAVRSNPRIAMR